MKMHPIIAILPLMILLLSAPVAKGEDGYTAEVKGYLSGYAASGDRALDNTHDIVGSNAALQASLRTPMELSFYFDGRYFGHDRQPENSLREGYFQWDTGALTVTAGKQIIVWGRADRFNPTDVITPRNYETVTFDDDDQRFGVEGAQAKYRITDEYSLAALALPAFHSSIVPSGLFPSGMLVSNVHDSYSSENAQFGMKLDRTGESLDWSVSYYRGFSTLPEVALNSQMELNLENRRIWMGGIDFSTSLGAWGIRGEAAYVDFEKRLILSELYPHSFYYSVLGAERTVADTLTVNLQWLHRQISSFNDPRTVTLPFSSIALGNALIHDQFDRIQDGISLNLRDKWLLDTLRAEITIVYFMKHHDYLVKPQVRYAVNDQWTIALSGDLYHGPDDSFLGGMRKNSLIYAELRYQFGPLVK